MNDVFAAKHSKQRVSGEATSLEPPDSELERRSLDWGPRVWGRTVLALTNSETLTCFVSEPDFRVSRFVSLRNMFGKSGGEISRKREQSCPG